MLSTNTKGKNMTVISVIVGSTREGRFSEKPAKWILQHLKKHEGVDVRLPDLRDFPMPFFDQPVTPATPGRPAFEHEVVRKWIAAGLSLTALFVFFLLGCEAAVAEDATQPAPQEYPKLGLLRERDLSPFGFLRLDMRPAHAVWAPPGSWGVEVLLGYQNTWVMSPNVQQYLESLPGRRRLGPADVAAIRAMPGEAYLVDLELGLVDVTLHYKLAEHWSVNATISGMRYSGGFLDGTIEDFHKAFGLSSFGRPAVARNSVNVILDLKSANTPFLLNAPPDGGVLDPTFGVRYSVAAAPSPWNLVLESAVKVPIDGQREFLSTGNTDVGLQATLQRFAGRHAGYVSAAAVRTKGSALTSNDRTQIVPTYILGYEYSVSQRTGVIAQYYISPSVLTHEDTDLEGLLKTKYQISVGVRHRVDASVWTFAITENTGNFDNTPDVGFQIGWTYSPAFRR